jgi:hypothetical protein
MSLARLSGSNSQGEIFVDTVMVSHGSGERDPVRAGQSVSWWFGLACLDRGKG